MVPHGRALSAAKTAGELRRAERLRLRREAKVAEREAKAAKAARAAGTRSATTRAPHDMALRRLVFVACIQLGHAIVLPSSVRSPGSPKLRSAKPKQYQPARQEDAHHGDQYEHQHQHPHGVAATARDHENLNRVLVAQSEIDGLNERLATVHRRWAPVVTQWATFSGIAAAGAGAMYLGGVTLLGGPAVGAQAAKMYLTATASGTAWTLGFGTLANGGERTAQSMGGVEAPRNVRNLVTSTAVKAGLEGDQVPTACLIPTDEPNGAWAGSTMSVPPRTPRAPRAPPEPGPLATTTSPSNLQPPTSNLQPPISNLQPPTSNLQPQPPTSTASTRCVPSAFAAGSWPSRRAVAVTQGLVDTLTTNELHAVIAHEIGHIMHHDCGRAIQVRWGQPSDFQLPTSVMYAPRWLPRFSPDLPRITHTHPTYTPRTPHAADRLDGCGTALDHAGRVGAARRPWVERQEEVQQEQEQRRR